MQIPGVMSHIWNFWCQRPKSNQGQRRGTELQHNASGGPETEPPYRRTNGTAKTTEPGPNRRGTNQRYVKDGTNFKTSIRAGRAKESLGYQKHTMVKIRDFKMLECAEIKVGLLQFLFILEIFVICNSSLFAPKWSRS